MRTETVNAGSTFDFSPVLASNHAGLQTHAAGGKSGPYALAAGKSAVGRLHLLHKIYKSAGKRVLLRTGLKAGMHVADFGCGVGVVTRMLAEMVGCSGMVTGIDIDKAQLREAASWCAQAGLDNVAFLEASADKTTLPRSSFDLVYCRFLLLHLPDPISCLREMRDVLKPGGILLIEDGDLSSAGSMPPSAHDEFANLFSRFGPLRGLNYSLSKDLYHLVKSVGFPDPKLEIHQPALLEKDERHFLQWSVAEAGAAFVNAGLISSEELEQRLNEMEQAAKDDEILILAPRMSIIWARKPAA